MLTFDHRKITFKGANGVDLAARMDLPARPPIGYALFAHCFTGSKDNLAASRISSGLAAHGLGVLRFDFTGLGDSDGDFSNTNFSSNIEDVIAAVNWMSEQEMPADVLIGHSLGGAAVLVAASQLPNVDAVVTIGAPSEPGHLMHRFSQSEREIEEKGYANLSLAGRPFTIRKQFLDDIKQARVLDAAAELKRPLMVMHSPIDREVGVENASAIFAAAKHPKSFISLDDADHLLTKKQDATEVASIISGWSRSYLSSKYPDPPAPSEALQGIVVEETGWGKYQNWVVAGEHVRIAAEPESLGGDDSGFTPFEYLNAALGACTSITLRMYADRKSWELHQVHVDVFHQRGEDGKSIFTRKIRLEGNLNTEQRARLIEIANKCPVHKTLHEGAEIKTIEST